MRFMAVSQQICVFQDLRPDVRKNDSVIPDQELSRVQPIHSVRVQLIRLRKTIPDKRTDSSSQVKTIRDTCSRLSSKKDPRYRAQIQGFSMTTRAAYFSPYEAEVLVKAYQEVKEEIKKKGNTATAIKQREKAWQSIADRLNEWVAHKY